MDQTTMVTDFLTSQMQQNGEVLVRALDDENMRVKAAFWIVVAELPTWRLYVATPLVDEKGPLEVYREVERIIKKKQSAAFAFELSNLTVVSPRHWLVTLLSMAPIFGLGASGVRFYRNTINGQFIEDAYIYRLNQTK